MSSSPYSQLAHSSSVVREELQLFIGSNRDRTYYFANKNARHFSFNQGERFLPIYEFADKSNQKITHAIDDGNVLPLYIDYFQGSARAPRADSGASPESSSTEGAADEGVGNNTRGACAPQSKRAVIDAILTRHVVATAHRRFNAILAAETQKHEALKIQKRLDVADFPIPITG